jgi:hypothetical protein
LTTSGIIALLKMTVAQAMVAHHGKPAEECSEFSSASSQSVGHPMPDAADAALAELLAVATVLVAVEAAADCEASSVAIPTTLLAGAAATTGAAAAAAPADDTPTAALVAAADAVVEAAAGAALAGAALNHPNRRTQTAGAKRGAAGAKRGAAACKRSVARADAAARKAG